MLLLNLYQEELRAREAFQSKYRPLRAEVRELNSKYGTRGANGPPREMLAGDDLARMRELNRLVSNEFRRLNPQRTKEFKASGWDRYRDANGIQRRRPSKWSSPSEKTRRNNLRRNYGIEPAIYDEMFLAQEGRCAICAQPECAKFRDNSKRLAIDHCHKTGKVRGLLCSRCNPMLGYAKDQIARLEAGIAYLRKHAVADV